MENEFGREAVLNWLRIVEGNTLGVTFYFFYTKKLLYAVQVWLHRSHTFVPAELFVRKDS
jgi:hypothetical protein